MRPYWLLLGACVLALVGSRERAHAQPERVIVGQDSPPEEPTTFSFVLINGGAGIPQNGALLIEGPYDAEPAVIVRNFTTSTVLEGAATPIEGSPFWVWVPDEPFPLGASCEIEVTSPIAAFEPNWGSFVVTEAIVLGEPVIQTAPSASLLSVVSAMRCCRARFAPDELQDSGDCFGVEYESSVQVDPGVFTTSGQALANQYLFRFITGPDERPVYSTGAFINLVLPIYREQAEEYCFEVTAIELPTLRELAYDGVDTCAEHGTLEDLGTTTIEPDETQLDALICHAPPVGYEEAWCEVNAACEGKPFRAGCELYAHVCEGEPLVPPPPDAGHTSSGEGDGDGDGDGEGDGEGDGDGDMPRGSGSGDGGCAIVSSATGAQSSALAPLIALAMLARRRRSPSPC